MGDEGKVRQSRYVERQKAKGLVLVQAWVTPAQRAEILTILHRKRQDAYIKEMRKENRQRTLKAKTYYKKKTPDDDT